MLFGLQKSYQKHSLYLTPFRFPIFTETRHETSILTIRGSFCTNRPRFDWISTVHCRQFFDPDAEASASGGEVVGVDCVGCKSYY